MIPPAAPPVAACLTRTMCMSSTALSTLRGGGFHIVMPGMMIAANQQQPDLLAPTDLPSVTRMLPPGFVCAGRVAILQGGTEHAGSQITGRQALTYANWQSWPLVVRGIQHWPLIGCTEVVHLGDSRTFQGNTIQKQGPSARRTQDDKLSPPALADALSARTTADETRTCF